MDISAYLDRIGLADAPEANLAGLARLQGAHLTAIPFENLDVFLGRPLSLAPPDLFAKIVSGRRGGYCFELNSLFGRLLAATGFAPVPHLARVWLRDPAETPPCTHLTHSLRLDGRRFLADVGFGAQTPRIPVPLDGEAVDDGGGPLRVVQQGDGALMVQRWSAGAWADQYGFDDRPALAIDVVVANHFVETHPSSRFRAHRMVGRFTADGRDALFDDQLSRRAGERLEERALPPGPAWREILTELFGIRLTLDARETARLDAPAVSAGS